MLSFTSVNKSTFLPYNESCRKKKRDPETVSKPTRRKANSERNIKTRTGTITLEHPHWDQQQGTIFQLEISSYESMPC